MANQDVLEDLLAPVTVLSAQFERKCAVVTFPTDTTPSIPQIRNLESLSRELPEICTNIFKTLGSQQCEATYQRCLALDLKEAGLLVEMEKEIQLVYKSEIVGTRRADLVVTTPSNEMTVLELKAVRNVYPPHAKQLQYYMEHFQIDHGYLINFPHDDGFPNADSLFDLKALKGVNDVSTLDGHYLRLKKDPISTDVQVVEFQRRKGEKKEERKKAFEKQKAKPRHWGITLAGKPCKVCIKNQRFCDMHLNQKP